MWLYWSPDLWITRVGTVGVGVLTGIVPLGPWGGVAWAGGCAGSDQGVRGGVTGGCRGCTMTGVGCLECKSMIEERSPQKHSVPLCQLPGANKTDEITVKPISFIHDLSLAPLSGRVSMMVQDPELVTSLEWRELPSSLLHQVFSDTVGSCSGVVYSMFPCLWKNFPAWRGRGRLWRTLLYKIWAENPDQSVGVPCGRSSSEAIEAAGGSLEQPAEHGGSSSLPAG